MRALVHPWAVLLLAVAVAVWALASCDDGVRSYDGDDDSSDSDSDGDSDGDSDSDSDSDADECEPPTWGSGAGIGMPVANWTVSGYADGDGDHVVEQEEVTFSLEDIHCRGVQSAVVLIGDTT